MNIFDYLKKLFEGDQENSDKARERLKEVLIKDRVKLSPDAQKSLTAEITKIVSEYANIAPEELHISVDGNGKKASLVASIPVTTGRGEIIKKEQKKKPPKKKKSPTKKSKKKPSTTKRKTTEKPKPKKSKSS